MKVARRDRHRRPQRQGLQRPRVQGPEATPRRSSASRPRLHLEERPPTTSRTSRARRARGTTSSIANGFLMGDATAAVAKRFPDTKFAIVDFPCGRAQGEAEERRAASSSRSRRPGTSPASRLRRWRRAARSLGRRPGRPGRSSPSSPATSAGAKKAKPGTKTLLGLLAGLRRPGEVQGARAEPDRAGLEGRLRRSPAAAGSARSRPRRSRASGASASTPTRRYLGTHILTSATKKVDVARLHDTIGCRQRRQVQGRRRRPLHRQERWRRLRQGQRRGAPSRAALIAKLTAVSKQIASGKVKPPTQVARRQRHHVERAGLRARPSAFRTRCAGSDRRRRPRSRAAADAPRTP